MNQLIDNNQIMIKRNFPTRDELTQALIQLQYLYD
jgi:hypothetical protein